MVHVLLAAVVASPSPSPRPSRFHPYVYIREYNASLAIANSTPKDLPYKVGADNLLAIVRGDYDLGTRGLYAGASYLYANVNPFTPQVAMSTLFESYLAYNRDRWYAKAGNQYFASPWADTHQNNGLPPSAFQGADVRYSAGNWTLELANMDRYRNRTATAFTRTTLLTSYPLGSPGMPSNTANGRAQIATNGFLYGRASYASTDGQRAANLYAYNMRDLLNMVWFTGRAAIGQNKFAPFVFAQLGSERNAGASYLGKIESSVVGLDAGFSPVRTMTISGGFNTIPWHKADVILPNGVTCASSGPTPTYQIQTANATFPYFLPQGTAQCNTHPSGATTVYYGGWATPYSDSLATDPFITSPAAQGLVDRRSPGVSTVAELDFTSPSKRIVLNDYYYWYNYSDDAVAQHSREWDTFVKYRFNDPAITPYKGFLLSYLYVQLRQTNVVYPNGAPFLGGIPFARYGRFLLEYTR